MLKLSANIKMLIFESQKWVILGAACEKRNASTPFVVRDGAWVGGVRRRKGWRNDWRVHIMIRSVVKMWGDECGAWERRVEAAERRPELLHLKSSVFRKWGRGDTSQASLLLVQPTTHHMPEPMASQTSAVKAPVGFLKNGWGIPEVTAVQVVEQRYNELYCCCRATEVDTSDRQQVSCCSLNKHLN